MAAGLVKGKSNNALLNRWNHFNDKKVDVESILDFGVVLGVKVRHLSLSRCSVKLNNICKEPVNVKCWSRVGMPEAHLLPD